MTDLTAGQPGSLGGRDGDEVSRRLAAARELLEHGFTPPPQERQRLLLERASALAKEPPPAETSASTIDVVEFLLAHERYAIAAAHVREIWPLRELTPLPCVPPFVSGIVNVRGEIVSVVDLKRFFDLPDRGLGELNKVILTQSGAMVVGFLADEVIGARAIPADEIQALPPTLTGIRAAFTLGVTRERVVVLDAVKMLSDESLVVHEEVEG